MNSRYHHVLKKRGGETFEFPIFYSTYASSKSVEVKLSQTKRNNNNKINYFR